MDVRSSLIYLLCAILPKRNTAVVYTFPAFDDTALALVPELEKTGLEKIYYLAPEDVHAGEEQDWGTKVVVLPKRSVRALWVFLTSRYVFCTHRCFTSRFPHNVESVNVWHGMPIKRIGWMAEGKKTTAPHAKYELATSEFWRPIIQNCMRPWGKVLISGLPRYDRFLALGAEQVRRRLGGEAQTCAQLVVWLPTYRHSLVGAHEQDGSDFRNEAQMPDFNIEAFESWLEARNMVCVLKPHPLGKKPQIRATGHLRIMDDAALASQGLSLYALLGGADVLLTDVSSVYVDFLLLDRPVIHTFADRTAYQASRGFTFDWTEKYLAGPMVEDMAGVQEALAELASRADLYAQQRSRLRQLFHANPNIPATSKLLDKLGLGPAFCFDKSGGQGQTT